MADDGCRHPDPDCGWPIIYSENYNSSITEKPKNIHDFLKNYDLLSRGTIEPTEITREELLMVHSPGYLKNLKDEHFVAKIFENAKIMTKINIDSQILRPYRFQTGGTIRAGKIALERGWAINLGGGFHHCSSEKGEKSCIYADISLLLKSLREKNPEVKVMIIDLDANRGNGYQRDIVELVVGKKENTYTLDIYNGDIFPGVDYTIDAIDNQSGRLESGVSDTTYLEILKEELEEAFTEFTPEVVVYIAGTDILRGDPLGKLNISPEGIIKRDEIVFRAVREQGKPIIMLTSSGYDKRNAEIIAKSIKNLIHIQHS